jgi:hypothetical protein
MAWNWFNLVNPNKYTIWWSVACDDQCKGWVLNIMQAKVVGKKKKYLGIYLLNKARGVDWTSGVLENHFWDKFTGWKIHLLSHLIVSLLYVGFDVAKDNN